MLNLHRLRILREIGLRGSVTAAAEALWMTPPSVSQHMSALEAETGVALLERVGRGVRLTPAAHRLVAHTEHMLAEMERAEADLAVAREAVAGSLAISAPATAARSIVIPAAVELLRDHPALELHLSDIEQPESLVELRSGNIDIALGLEYTFTPVVDQPGFDIELLVSEPVYVALPASHPLAGAPNLRLADLRDERWFAARGPNPCRDAVLQATANGGFEPRIELLSTIDYQVTLAAVGAGLGVTLVPHLALYGDYPDVSLSALTDPPLRRRIFAAMREGSRTSPAVAAALEALHRAAETVARSFREDAETTAA
ncbi:MAG: LysR family transcriptional regulator [Actinobacteria bacterium]|nr:MAG: LysR family transcriptional regulator [Actinomycetota bacterium]